MSRRNILIHTMDNMLTIIETEKKRHNRMAQYEIEHQYNVLWGDIEQALKNFQRVRVNEKD